MGSGWAAVCHTGQRRRIAWGQREDKGRGSRWGGRGGGGDVCQEGWLGSTSEGTEGRKKVSQAFVISLYPFISFCLFLSTFSHHIWTHSVLFFLPFFNTISPSCPDYMSSRLSSFSFIPFIVLYLSSAPSFHFCLFVCVLTIFSLLHLFTGKELGVRSVPVESRLCHPTKRVGVKHRHRHSLPGRWHHVEANGCRETWIYVCRHPLIQDLISLVHLHLKE